MIIHAGFPLLNILSAHKRSQSLAIAHERTGLDKFNIPNPNFHLGQQVTWQFTCDDTIDRKRYGKTFNEAGMIIGMVWCPGHFSIDGWIYTIRMTQSELHPPQEGEDVELHEAELTAKKWGLLYE